MGRYRFHGETDAVASGGTAALTAATYAAERTAGAATAAATATAAAAAAAATVTVTIVASVGADPADPTKCAHIGNAGARVDALDVHRHPSQRKRGALGKEIAQLPPLHRVPGRGLLLRCVLESPPMSVHAHVHACVHVYTPCAWWCVHVHSCTPMVSHPWVSSTVTTAAVHAARVNRRHCSVACLLADSLLLSYCLPYLPLLSDLLPYYTSAELPSAFDSRLAAAQCEELRHPELAGHPIGIQQKMLVITSNYAARAFGVRKGDALQEVRRKCPQITILSGEDLTYYRWVSQRVFDTVSAWSPAVERLGMDELFIDLTDAVDRRLEAAHGGEGCVDDDAPTAVLPLRGFLYPSPNPNPTSIPSPNSDPNERDSAADETGSCARRRSRVEIDPIADEMSCVRRLSVCSRICEEIRESVREGVGLTTSAGISVSKLLAKLVASEHKARLLFAFPPPISHLPPSHLPPSHPPTFFTSCWPAC